MFAVKTFYNTDENNNDVAPDTSPEDLPCTYHGPFDSLREAFAWMTDVYPDDDTDVDEQIVADFDVPVEWLNDPSSLFP